MVKSLLCHFCHSTLTTSHVAWLEKSIFGIVRGREFVSGRSEPEPMMSTKPQENSAEFGIQWSDDGRYRVSELRKKAMNGISLE